jgi:hypothetical protein
MLTSYYASKLLDPNEHFLVRTSIGAPRYCRHRIDATLEMLYPHPNWLTLKQPTYTRRYITMLNGLGVPAIEKALAALRSQAGKREIVFLCFESLSPKNVSEGQFCHRRIFAKWWHEQTGEEIAELRTPNVWTLPT